MQHTLHHGALRVLVHRVAHAIAADGRRLGVDLASIIALKIDSSFVSKHCVNGEIVLSWKPKRALRTPLSSPQRSCKCMQYKGNAESLLVSLPHCACQQHVPSVRTLGFQK